MRPLTINIGQGALFVIGVDAVDEQAVAEASMQLGRIEEQERQLKAEMADLAQSTGRSC